MIDLTKPLRTIKGKYKALFLSKWTFEKIEYYCFTINEGGGEGCEPWQHRNFSEDRIDEVFEETPEPLVVNGFLNVYDKNFSLWHSTKDEADKDKTLFKGEENKRIASIDLSKHEFAIGEGLNPEYEITKTITEEQMKDYDFRGLRIRPNY